MTHFERLGLSPHFALDAAEIERAYLARSRELHPDRHTLASSAEQRASMELTAALNEAYATLKQPFRRAEYLLSLLGGPMAAEHKEMAPAFLEEMLELRIEIEELRENPDPDSPGRVSMQKQLAARQEKLIAELAGCFAKLEVPPHGRSLLVQVRQTLNAARYVQGLLRDLRAD